MLYMTIINNRKKTFPATGCNKYNRNWEIILNMNVNHSCDDDNFT